MAIGTAALLPLCWLAGWLLRGCARAAWLVRGGVLGAGCWAGDVAVLGIVRLGGNDACRS
jgi:hypothetical protein